MSGPGRLRALAVVSLLALSRRAPAAAPEPIEIVFHSDLDGRLALPRCERPAREGTDYAKLAGAIRASRTDGATATAQDRSAPSATQARATLAMLGANILGPGLLARAAFDESPARAAAAFAGMFQRAGYDVFTVGSHDLGLPAAWLDRFVDEMSRRGVPLVASNLRCNADAWHGRPRLCAASRPRLLIDRAGARVGVVATLSPQLRRALPAAASHGLTFDDPLPVVRAAVAQLRADGANVVVWLTQVSADRAGLDELRDQQSALAVGVAPDLVLASGLADAEGTRAVRLLQQDGAPPVSGSTTGTAAATVVAIRDDSGGRAVNARRLPAAPAAADADVAMQLEPFRLQYCHRYGAQVASTGGRAVERDAFLRYVAQIARRRAGAEIALINRGFVKQVPFPLEGSVTSGDLAEAMPYPAVLGIVRVTGAALEATIAPALHNPRLVAAGIERGATGKVTVNGRPIDKARRYRIATIAFVADGGDDLLPPSTFAFSPLPGQPELASLVEAFMRDQPAARDHDPTVDPATDFGAPPAQRPLLLGVAELGLNYAATSISNAAAYTDAQLTRAEQRTLRAELTSLIALRAPRHEADGRLALKYGQFWNQPTGQAAVSGESDDLVVASATYNYRAFRPPDGGSRSLVPDPYLRATLESEITRPAVTPEQTRTYRHAELTATMGGLVGLSSKLRLRAGAGVRKELVASGNPGRWRPVAEAGGVLDQTALLTAGEAVVRLEANADYLFIDPEGSAEHQLRAMGRVSVPLLPSLFFTTGVDLFAVRQGGRRWGYATDVTVGLRVHVDAAHQAL